MFEQIWPVKQNGVVFERHVYSGPQGEGFIDYRYQINGAGKVEVMSDHHGPEARIHLPLDWEDAEINLKPDREGKIKHRFKDVITGDKVWERDRGITDVADVI